MSLAVRVVRADGLPGGPQGQLPRVGNGARGDGARALGRGRGGSPARRASRPGRPARRALRTGHALWSVDDEEDAYRIGAEVLRRLWREPPLDHPFVLLRDLARRWAERLEHRGNVLRTNRDRWLAIDPKPVVGECPFDTASLVRDRRESLLAGSSPRKTLERRLDQLAAELDLDRERMQGWGIAHALAWGSKRGDDRVRSSARSRVRSNLEALSSARPTISLCSTGGQFEVGEARCYS